MRRQRMEKTNIQKKDEQKTSNYNSLLISPGGPTFFEENSNDNLDRTPKKIILSDAIIKIISNYYKEINKNIGAVSKPEYITDQQLKAYNEMNENSPNTNNLSL